MAAHRFTHPVARVALGAFILSIGPVLVADLDTDPLLVTFGRMAVGVIVFGIPAVLATRMGRLPMRSFAAGCLLALDLVCYHHAIRLIGPGLATIINNLHAVLITAAAILLGRSVLDPRRAGAAIALTVAGLLLLHDGASSGRFGDGGILVALLSSVFYAVSIVLQKRTPAAPTSIPAGRALCAHMAAVSTGGMLVALCAAIASGVPWNVPLTAVTAIAGYGMLSQVIGWLLISSAISAVPVERTGFLLLLQPVGSVILELLFLGTRYSAGAVAGAAAMLAGALVVGVPAANRRRAATESRGGASRTDDTAAGIHAPPARG